MSNTPLTRTKEPTRLPDTPPIEAEARFDANGNIPQELFRSQIESSLMQKKLYQEIKEAKAILKRTRNRLKRVSQRLANLRQKTTSLTAQAPEKAEDVVKLWGKVLWSGLLMAILLVGEIILSIDLAKALGFDTYVKEWAIAAGLFIGILLAGKAAISLVRDIEVTARLRHAVGFTALITLLGIVALLAVGRASHKANEHEAQSIEQLALQEPTAQRSLELRMEADQVRSAQAHSTLITTLYVLAALMAFIGSLAAWVQFEASFAAFSPYLLFKLQERLKARIAGLESELKQLQEQELQQAKTLAELRDKLNAYLKQFATVQYERARTHYERKGNSGKGWFSRFIGPLALIFAFSLWGCESTPQQQPERPAQTTLFLFDVSRSATPLTESWLQDSLPNWVELALKVNGDRLVVKTVGANTAEGFELLAPVMLQLSEVEQTGASEGARKRYANHRAAQRLATLRRTTNALQQVLRSLKPTERYTQLLAVPKLLKDLQRENPSILEIRLFTDGIHSEPGMPERSGFSSEAEAIQQGKSAAEKLYPGLRLNQVSLTIYWQAQSQPRPFLKDYWRAFYTALAVQQIHFIQR